MSADSHKPTLFADGVLEASVHHGVARLTLGQLGADGRPAACGQLVVPLAQLPSVANGLIALLRQIEAKAREAQQAGAAAAASPQPAPAAHEPPAAEATMPGTFTFGGR